MHVHADDEVPLLLGLVTTWLSPRGCVIGVTECRVAT